MSGVIAQVVQVSSLPAVSGSDKLTPFAVFISLRRCYSISYTERDPASCDLLHGIRRTHRLARPSLKLQGGHRKAMVLARPSMLYGRLCIERTTKPNTPGAR
jgi:hypothetical protein